MITLYYYKNFFKQDGHVEVDNYVKVHNAFSTPPALKKLISLEDAGTHFIGSDVKSNNTAPVEAEIIEFLKEILGIDFR